MLVVQRASSRDAGVSLPPLQPMENQQTTLWKTVGKAPGWNAGRCRHVQMSELFSMEICQQGVMDFLAATDVGKFPPRLAEQRGQEERGQQERRQVESGQEERE